MEAAAFDEFGSAEVLRAQLLPRPRAGTGDVLVRIIRAGVQLTDAAIRAGWTPPGVTIEFPQVPGNEFSGIVEDVGSDVSAMQVGDEVLGYSMLGCYAEFAAVPADQVIPKPPGLDWEQAGALSASGQTALTAFEDLEITSRDRVLVHGAAGGVGTIFTQLAVLAGAEVVGTASEGNHDYLRYLGAEPIAYGPGQLERIRELPGGYDVAFDAAGHENLQTAVQVVADRKRIATIVDMPLADELGCRIVRSRRSADRLARLARLVSDNRLRVHVRRSFDLDEAGEAHRDVETGRGRGKVVLRIAELR
ncbi:NADP-dependent oxidoreductase [Brevibacterium sp. UCMA 11752]|nr:NADP-dependent oxidoreductase [Brevibacterium sp. UCMA 11752]